jgi:hypothetical protein
LPRIQNRERIGSSINCVEKTIQLTTCGSIKLGICLSPYTNINSWINNLNVRPKTLKLVKQHIRENLHDTLMGNTFLDGNSKAQMTKPKIDK